MNPEQRVSQESSGPNDTPHYITTFDAALASLSPHNQETSNDKIDFAAEHAVVLNAAKQVNAEMLRATAKDCAALTEKQVTAIHTIELELGREIPLVELIRIKSLLQMDPTNMVKYLPIASEKLPTKVDPEAHLHQLNELSNISSASRTVLNNIPFETNLTLFEPLISKWRQAFDQTSDNMTKAKLFQFMSLIANPFIDALETPAKTFLSLIEAEWRTWKGEPEANLSDNDLKPIVLTLKRGLTEMSVASTLDRSAWAYVGKQFGRDLINLLCHPDRDIAMKYFDDLLGLTKKGKYLFPPQMFHLLTRDVEPEYRPNNQQSASQGLVKFYRDGKSLLDYTDKLNFIVTGVNRAEEHSFLQMLLKKVDKTGPYWDVCSGPPLEALMTYHLLDWKGELRSIDALDVYWLIVRALAMDNEFSGEDRSPSKILHPNEVAEKIDKLAGSHYPITAEDYGPIKWHNHHVITLPNEAGYQSIPGEKPTLMLNTRGLLLYTDGPKQLEAMLIDFQTLSPKPGSLMVMTRGLAWELLMEAGFQRDKQGCLKIATLDTTDAVFSTTYRKLFDVDGTNKDQEISQAEIIATWLMKDQDFLTAVNRLIEEPLKGFNTHNLPVITNETLSAIIQYAQDDREQTDLKELEKIFEERGQDKFSILMLDRIKGRTSNISTRFWAKELAKLVNKHAHPRSIQTSKTTNSINSVFTTNFWRTILFHRTGEMIQTNQMHYYLTGT